MIELTNQERKMAEEIRILKDQAGSHSPSMFTITEKIPKLKLKVDACFLSNPYATELFLKYLKRELIDTGKMRDVLEFYPSQNDVIASILSGYLDIPAENIFIGNGAVEIIQAVVHDFTSDKILINIPTFSSYYEFAKPETTVSFNRLDKNNDYRLDLQKYLELINIERPDTVVLINPNNPDGGYMKFAQVESLLENLAHIKTVIIDESFIHFAFESEDYQLKSTSELIGKYENLVIVKSMSKDFGIAGIRAGYAIMSAARVQSLLKNGYLWNSNGLAEYFFRLYVRKDFLEEYERARVGYIKETQHFFQKLRQIGGIKVYPSMANFALVELLSCPDSLEFVSRMLIRYGVYMRTCSDKIGIEGEFVRIASRKREENEYILDSIKSMLTS